MTVDKTRENIGADALEEGSRKELFKKFVDAGGEVVNDKQKRRALAIDRDKQKEILRREEEKKKKRKQEWESEQREKNSKNSKKSSSKSAQVDLSKDSSFSMLSKLKVNFTCWIKGISPLTGPYYQNKFIQNIDGELRNLLSGLNIFFIEIIQGNPKYQKKIIEDLDSRNLLYYELLQKMADLYDMHDFFRFSEVLRKYYTDAIPVKSLASEIKILFRKLYILRNYQSSMVSAIDLSSKYMIRAESAQSTTFAKKRRKALQELNTMFTKYIPLLYWAVLKSEERFLPLSDPRLELILGIQSEDYPGQRTPGHQSISEERIADSSNEQNQEKADNASDESEEQEEDQKAKKKEPIVSRLPKGIQIGLNMMKTLQPGTLREKFDSNGNYNHLENRDKVFYAYLLFREFDQEFSFVLTTNRIKLNQDYSGGNRIDYRKKLNDIFLMSQSFYEQFEHYSQLTKELLSLREVNPSQAGYIQHSKRVTELENKRLSAARTTRRIVQEMMERTSEILEILIRDAKGNKKIVNNPEEQLSFDKNIEGNKKLNNQSISNALQYTYAFAYALAYRLSDEQGDLYGAILELDQDIFGNTFTDQQVYDVSDQEDLSNDNDQERKEPSFQDKKQSEHTINDELDQLGF